MSSLQQNSNTKIKKLKSYNKILCEYVDPEELSSIIGKVRRERQNRKDNIMLSQYCYNQIQNYLSPTNKEKSSTENTEGKRSKAKDANRVEVDVEKPSVRSKEALQQSKTEVASITGLSCICSCSPIKQTNASVVSEETTNIDNVCNANILTPNIPQNNKADRSKVLGYSNITLVSSHRDAVSGNIDGVDNNPEKVKTIRLKIKRVLDVILSNVETVKSPEDDIEKSQLKQKAVEFCGRFSRNHLYEIGRALNETTKALNYCLPYNQWKQVTSQSKSILNVHQILLQAFSMFQRHMRIVWGYGDTHEKLHTLLQLTLEVNRICFPHQDKVDSNYNDLQNGCNKLIDTLNSIFGEDNNSCISKSSLYYKEYAPGLVSRKIGVASSRVSNDLSYMHRQTMKWRGVSNSNSMIGDRFSMYRQQMPRPNQNRRTLNGKGQKNSVPRKSKSNHVFPSSTTESRAKPITQMQSKSCHQIGTTPMCGLQKRPQDITNKKKNPPRIVRGRAGAKKRGESRMDVIYPNTHMEPLDECSNNSDELNDQGCDCDVMAAGEPLNLQLKNDAKTPTSTERRDKNEDAVEAESRGYNGGKASTTLTKCDVEGMQSVKTINVANREQRILSKSGSSNVLLLVLKHDDSKENDEKDDRKTLEMFVNSVEHSDKINKDLQVHEGEQILNEENHENKTIFGKEENKGLARESPEKEKNNLDAITMKPVPITKTTPVKENALKKKIRKNFSPGAGDIFHNYRIDFIKSLMENPLYVQENIKRPWEVVERISDKLIDEAIRTVSEEMEMEELLKQMLDVELQDFPTSKK